MDQETERAIDQDLLRLSYVALAAMALLGGLMVCAGVVFGRWILAVFLYLLATIARIGAGSEMNRMGDAVTVNAWNDRYHRFVTIALNFGAGAVLLGELWWIRWSMGERYDYMRARWFLTIAVILYIIAQRFTRPNTFGARLRSAILTAVLIGVMAHLAWPGQWGLWVLMGVIALNITMLRLRALQRRFGWADR